MPFADHFRKASVTKGTLTVECKKADGKTWVPVTVNLDDYIGNINGKFDVTKKGFSQSASNITVNNGVLAAKLKTEGGNSEVEAKLDLGSAFYSHDGVFARLPAATPALSTPPATPAATTAAIGARTVAHGGSATSASSTTQTSQSSMSTSSTSHTSVSRTSSSSSSTVFSSSKFRYHSQQLLLQDTCTNFHLQGAWLHCDIHHEDSRITRASVDLDLYIGDVDGRLVWDGKGFSKTCTDIHLDSGFILTAKCHNPDNRSQFLIGTLDLRTRLRVQGSIIICVETNKKLSMMLSEVPWMKFKVIAEPDLSVFSSHPVVKQTMTRIAESTVEHVTKSMHTMITKAMETAIVEITASAMQHIATQMEHTVQDAVGYAAASPSATESEFLHIGAMGAYGHAHGHAHGHYHGGVVHGGHAHGHGSVQTRGGVWAGWSHSSVSGSATSHSSSSSTHTATNGHTATATRNASGSLVSAHV